MKRIYRDGRIDWGSNARNRSGDDVYREDTPAVISGSGISYWYIAARDKHIGDRRPGHFKAKRLDHLGSAVLRPLPRGVTP